MLPRRSWQGLNLGHPRGLVEKKDELHEVFCRVTELVKSANGPETSDRTYVRLDLIAQEQQGFDGTPFSGGKVRFKDILF